MLNKNKNLSKNKNHRVNTNSRELQKMPENVFETCKFICVYSASTFEQSI